MEEDKERISISLSLDQLKKLNQEQDQKKISTRSKTIRMILDEHFKMHQTVDGTENVVIKIPAGLLNGMRGFIQRKDNRGKPSPLFINEEEIIIYALRRLVEKYNG